MRIETKDLRIGNRVNYYSDAIDRWIDNKELSMNDLICIDSDVDHAEAIPLTEEWIKASKEQLLVAGYVIEKQEASTFTKGGYKLVYTSIDPPLLIGNVDFVHKLQNLFFALEDAELEFKTLTPIR